LVGVALSMTPLFDRYLCFDRYRTAFLEESALPVGPCNSGQIGYGPIARADIDLLSVTQNRSDAEEK